jgi:hypothetical protein
MSKLDDAMQERIAEIVFIEHRPFSYRDFTRMMRHKTYRNKICKLRKQGIVELDYKTPTAYYTLTGYRFGKSGTHTHTGGSVPTISNNDPIYNMLKNLDATMGQAGIHNIRLTFYAPNIHDAFVINSTFSNNPNNLDITLPLWKIDNAKIQIRIHKTDIVSIIIACSQEPFTLDYKGKTAFFMALAQTRTLLVGIMLSIYSQDINFINHMIPDYRDWVIRMWHIGRDSLELSKKDFHVTVERAGYIIERLYTKDLKGKNRIRHELQEYPNKIRFKLRVSRFSFQF